MCLVLLFLGAGLALKWGRLDFETPAPAEHVSFAEQSKRALWYLDIVVIGGLVGGLLAAGAGGRLAMRLLAVTAGDRAQGRITEADEVVGEVTVGGTIGFIVFGGLFAGLCGDLPAVTEVVAKAAVGCAGVGWGPAGDAGQPRGAPPIG